MFCRVCNSDLSNIFFQKNMPPQAQFFPDTKKDSNLGIDLIASQCNGCGLIQLENENVTYYREVVRASGFSNEMNNFRFNQFEKLINFYQLQKKKIIEVGCGKGEYLSIIDTMDVDAYGIEFSLESVENCKNKGLKVSNGFIDSTNYTISNGPFDVFLLMSFLEHIPQINQFLKGIRNNLNENALGLVEVPNFDMIIQEKLFSEFIPDHLFYFTNSTLKRTLEFNGFDVIDCKPIWHDYIISAVVKKRGNTNLEIFENSQNLLIKKIRKYVDNYDPKKVAVWGAGHQALALISLADLSNKISYVVDSASFKQNKFTPATNIPVFSPSKLKTEPVDAVIVIGAAYTEEIVEIIKKEFSDIKQIAKIIGAELIKVQNELERVN